MRQIVIACFHIERILDLGLPSRDVMEFRFDTDALPVLFGEYVDFMRRAAARERDACTRPPSVRAQHLGEELLEREPRRAEREDRTLDGIPRGDSGSALVLQIIERVRVDILGAHPFAQFMLYACHDMRARGLGRAGAGERYVELARVERFTFPIGLRDEYVGHAYECDSDTILKSIGIQSSVAENRTPTSGASMTVRNATGCGSGAQPCSSPNVLK